MNNFVGDNKNCNFFNTLVCFYEKQSLSDSDEAQFFVSNPPLIENIQSYPHPFQSFGPCLAQDTVRIRGFFQIGDKRCNVIGFRDAWKFNQIPVSIKNMSGSILRNRYLTLIT